MEGARKGAEGCRDGCWRGPGVREGDAEKVIFAAARGRRDLQGGSGNIIASGGRHCTRPPMRY